MKSMKRVLTLFVALAMVMSCVSLSSIGVFASHESEADAEVYAGHIVFDEVKTGEVVTDVKAKAFVRNYSEKASTAQLLCASYNAQGMLVDVSMATGMNTVLVTDEVTKTDNVKAYLWNGTQAPVYSNTATYGKGIAAAGVKITLNDTDITNSFTDGVYNYNVESSEYPTVKATTTDSSIYTEVKNEADKSVVNVYYGQRTSSVMQEGQETLVYNKPVATYTINYIAEAPAGYEEKAVHGMEDLQAGYYKLDGTKGDYTVGVADRKYVKVVDIEEGKAATEVTVTITGDTDKQSIIIIKPLGESAGKDAVAKDVSGDAFSFDQVDDKIIKMTGETTENGKYGQYNKDDTTTRVYKETQNSTPDGQTGNRWTATGGSASPKYGTEIYELPTNLLGYNYMLSGETKNFWINKKSEIIVLTIDEKTVTINNEAITPTLAANDEAENVISNKRDMNGTLYEKSYFMARAISTYDANPTMYLTPWTVAALIKDHGYSEKDFVKSGSKGLWLAGTCSGDSLDNLELYQLAGDREQTEMPYFAFDRYEAIIEKMGTSKTMLPSHTKFAGVVGTGCATYETLFDGYTLDRALANYNAEIIELSAPTALYVNMEKELNSKNWAAAHVHDNFPWRNDDPTKYVCLVGQDAAEKEIGNYHFVCEIPEALELEGNTVAYWANDVTNADYGKDWYIDTEKDLMKFTAGKNIEVMVGILNEFVRVEIPFLDGEGSNWIKLEIPAKETLILDNAEEQYPTYSLPRLYAQKFNAGETVVIKTPVAKRNMVVFIRELP